MASLFDDIPHNSNKEDLIRISLPKDFKPNDFTEEEILVIKMLAIVNTPLPKTTCKNMAKAVIDGLFYPKIKKGTIDLAIENLVNKKVLLPYDNGYILNLDLSIQLYELVKHDTFLIKRILEFFKEQFYYYRDMAIRLAIMVNDFQFVEEKVFSYGYLLRDTPVICFRNIFMELGDFSYVTPFFLSSLAIRKHEFLEAIPYFVSYDLFSQLNTIYLNEDLKPSQTAIDVYTSCAFLVLDVNQALDVAKSLKLPDEALFFADLLHGNTDLALEKGASFLTYIQNRDGHKRKELPAAFGLLYAITLIASGDLTNLTLAATFLRQAQKELKSQGEESNPFKDFAKMIMLFVNHKLGKKPTSGHEIVEARNRFLHFHFLGAVMTWFGKPLKKSIIPDQINEYGEFEYRAAGFIFAKETDKQATERLKVLRAKFNTVPLAELYQPEELWEDVLTILASAVTSKEVRKSEESTVDKRLIWLVDPLNFDTLRCLEQNRNKSGWNKGKDRSLPRMLNALPDFATLNDHAILQCLQIHSYYRNDVVVKDPAKLIRALANHPDVYTVSEPYLPLSIRIQEAQIQIDSNSKGVTIQLNPSSPNPPIVKETPTSYLFTVWSAKALQVYNVLNDANLKSISIPKSGMGKAKPVIERLGEVMPVVGNFAQGSGTKKACANIPVIQLTPINGQLHVQLLIEAMEGEEIRFVPGIGSSEVLMKDSKNNQYNIQRNRDTEKQIVLDLASRMDWLQEMKVSSPQIFIDEEGDILDFLAQLREQAPEVKVIWPKGERMRVSKVLSADQFSIRVKQSQDWFAIDGEITIDEKQKMSIQQLLDKSKGGTLKYIQLDETTYLSICADLQKRLAALNVVAHQKGKQMVVHPLGAAGIEQFIDGSLQLETDKNWKQHLLKIAELKNYQPSLATNLQAELRPYQTEGVLWLDRLHNWGVGACLADDMGLGKTIQGISLLLKYASNGPSLVLAPSSVCGNWIKEISRFAPTLTTVELKLQNRKEDLEGLKPHDVLVVSYGLIQSNPDLLAAIPWNIVILDEAHAIKNAKSVRSKAVMKLDAKFKMITTGTPIQNHLGELWNLFQFINPGMLGSAEEFNRRFVQNEGTPEGQQSRKSLNRYISPFILRRNKNEVLDDLPEKTEIVLQVTLSEQERAMYEVLRQNAIKHIEDASDEGGNKHLQILAEITKLRQMCCHPQLVVPDSPISSSKLEAFETLVDDLLDAKHKALVFSQFTKHLSLIRALLDKKGITYQYLDGSTPMKQREIAIENFQNGQSDLFLISLKAGGVGLNLTAADYVIHMDPWWNPAVEDQASDRAHRIGQLRPVTIYRLIAEDSIEEKIVRMHHDKRDLADTLLENTDQSAKISSQELFNLIAEK